MATPEFLRTHDPQRLGGHSQKPATRDRPGEVRGPKTEKFRPLHLRMRNFYIALVESARRVGPEGNESAALKRLSQ